MSNTIAPERLALIASGAPVRSVKVDYYNMGKDAPVCIVIPGYRDPGLSHATNTETCKALSARNISSISFEYSLMNFEDEHDAATIETHIADLEDILNLIHDKKHYFWANSFGAIPALEVANKNTAGIVLTIPAAHLFTKTLPEKLFSKSVTKAWVERSFNKKGYFYSKNPKNPEAPPFKMTKEFWQSGQNLEFQLLGVLENKSLPPCEIVVHDKDRYSTPEDAASLAEHLEKAGGKTKITILPESLHQLTPATIRAGTQAMIKLCEPDLTL